MKYKHIITPLIFIFILIYSSQNNALTLKIATLAPNGSFWMNTMKEGANEVKKKTDGRVKFKFYPGGIMGDDQSVFKKMRIGQLQGGAMTGGSLARLFPDSQIYSLPLVFKNFNEVDYARKHMDQQIIDGFKKAGIVTFGLAEGGLAYTMSNTAISKTSDLINKKVWSPANDMTAQITLNAYDVNPIPLNIGDVLSGLQSNLINTLATSPIAAIALQWHTQVEYITDVPLIYFYATLAIDEKAFNKIKIKDQAIVYSIMSDAFEKIDKRNRIDNLAAFDALKKQGIKVITPKQDEITDWYIRGRIAADLISKKGAMSDKVINELTMHLKKFRQKNLRLSENDLAKDLKIPE